MNELVFKIKETKNSWNFRNSNKFEIILLKDDKTRKILIDRLKYEEGREQDEYLIQVLSDYNHILDSYLEGVDTIDFKGTYGLYSTSFKFLYEKIYQTAKDIPEYREIPPFRITFGKNIRILK